MGKESEPAKSRMCRECKTCKARKGSDYCSDDCEIDSRYEGVPEMLDYNNGDFYHD